MLKRVNPRQKVRAQSMPAPVGGWNARDSIASMPKADAVYLRNLWPTATDIMVRKGSEDHATGLPDAVETLMPYTSAAGTKKLFAASGTGIYDVSAAGAVGAAVSSSLTSAQMQYTQFSTTGGDYLYCVNGADKPRLYSGAAWVSVDGVSVPAITGVTTTLLIHVMSFKKRLFFIESGSMSAWYLPVLAIGGAASELDFTSVFRKGGYLMAMDVWTLDAGYGVDDMAVFVTSEGEVAVYRGTDPSSATDWSLVGIYQLAKPVGRKCITKYGGDLLILTHDGLFPLSAALQSARVDTKSAVTDKIQQAVSDSIKSYSANYGWQIFLFPPVDMMIVNVPAGEGLQEQYVMNTITKAWGNFTAWPANCWEMFNDELYFGEDGKVRKAWSTYADNGENIFYDGLTAFNSYGSSASQKFWKMVRPILAVGGAQSYGIAMNVDYSMESTVQIKAVGGGTAGLWDTAVWDSGVWGSGVNYIIKQWLSCTAIGYVAALRFKGEQRLYETRLLGYDVTHEPGGIL